MPRARVVLRRLPVPICGRLTKQLVPPGKFKDTYHIFSQQVISRLEYIGWHEIIKNLEEVVDGLTL